MQLKRRAPVLLLIDLYEPKPDFDRWFKRNFLSAIRLSEEQLVLVLADLPARIAAVQGEQDEFFLLGFPDRQDIRRHFKSLSGKLQPHLTPTELNVYVESIMKDPGLLIKLSRLLSLARSSDTAGYTPDE